MKNANAIVIKMTATAYAVDVVQMEKGVIALNVVIDMVKKLICKNCGKTIEFVIQKEYRNKKGYWRHKGKLPRVICMLKAEPKEDKT